MKMDSRFELMLRQVEKPARYIGGEVNMVKKDPADVSVRFGFAFPDIYEIGMSYLGLQILYDIMNKEDDVYCERVFAPGLDMEKLMRESGLPLFTLETMTPVKELDILGFTLQYELSYTNVLNMLDLGGIPLKSCDRGEEFPVIVAGGPCAFNPEPLAGFIDMFMIGDGEELNVRICRLKKECGSKDEFLKRACEIDGVYVPAFYEPVYKDDGTLERMEKLYDRAPSRVRKAVVGDLDVQPFPERPVVPFIDTVHDRAVVETFRGCTRGCRFCQAGIIYRPVRERKKETIERLADTQLRNTGHDELSLLSLSTSDYSRFEELAVELMRGCREREAGLSLPSLRLDSFSFKVLDEISGYRKSGLTFAPEAGSQRLRDVINKNITEEDITGAVRKAVELGWDHIKLYFMAGLPTETYEDLEGIRDLVLKIREENFKIRGRKGGRFRVTVSVSNFVPKAHTPFQWEAQDRPEEFMAKHDFLSAKLRIKGVQFNYHGTETSNLEAVFARGDRRVGKVLEKAVSLGCRFDSWSEHFDPALWQEAFESSGIDPGFYVYRKRPYDEVLPWEIIDPLITRDFLIDESKRASREETTPDCRLGCAGCGVNRYTKCFEGVEEMSDV